jgi:tight adherence protein B
MILLSSLACGAFAYLAMGLVMGVSPLRRLEGPAADRRRRPGRWQLWLDQAGVRLSPRQFVTGSVAVGLFAFLAVGAMTRTPGVALMPAVVTGCGPAAFFARQRAARLRAVQLAWADALRELSSSIAAGLSLDRALGELAEAGPGPIRVAFGRFPTLSRALGPVAALEVVKEELAHPTSDRVIEVLVLAQRRGGQVLLTIIDELTEATTDDLNTHEEIKTNALEGKINARIVFSLPWLVLLLLVARPGLFQDFYRSPGGLVIVVVAGIWSVLGLWLVQRFARPRGEPRVFGAAPTLAAPTVVGPVDAPGSSPPGPFGPLGSSGPPGSLGPSRPPGSLGPEGRVVP